MIYEIKSEQFNGPLDKLLSLIEERKIEITKLSLAGVTADFIKYVEKLEQGADPGILSDFVVIAARLLLIKSKVLLPNLELTQEEEGDIADLEYRLKIYREFSARGGSASGGENATQYLKQLWDKHMTSQTRPLLIQLGNTSFFYPPKEMSKENLESAMRNLFTILQGLLPETKKIKVTVITLQEKISELSKRLTDAASVTFAGLTHKRDRQEVIVLFLAVLHMLAHRLAEAEQGNLFGDIVVKKSEAQVDPGGGLAT